MNRLGWILLCCFFLAAVPAQAQFYSAGTDPGRVRWSQVYTDNYRMIYPRGLDSLARVYALSLQQEYPRIGRSAGYAPSQFCRQPMPVILHAFTSYGNGMVMWAPRRMELYTVGDPADADPLPWIRNLTTHEPRHASQMQVGRTWPFKALRWLTGDLSDVVWWSVYTGIAFSEGDAVVAETALTPFGRGRSADFLEYVRVAFDEGDWRDYYRWRYGSIRRFTPDHYRAGYILAAGLRTSWDEPLFLKKYHDNLHTRKLPFPFLNMQYTIRQTTGLPTVKAAFAAISQDFQAVWADNDACRAEVGGAFVDDTALTPLGRRYTAFRGAVGVGDDIYAIETGLEHATRLARIAPDGTVTSLGAFSSSASDLRYAAGRLYWSEEVRDPRWSLAGTSILCYKDLDSGQTSVLLRGGRYYNPAPSEDGSRVAALDYARDGSHRVLVLDTASGAELQALGVPAGMQPSQAAWIGERLFVSAVTDEGLGVYEATADWRCVLPGGPSKIKQLRTRDSLLWFVCDKDGVNELYACDPDAGTLRQFTSLRHGGQDFVFDAAGERLRYTVLETGGRRFHEAPVAAFTPVASAWDSVWRNPVAEKLSAQERALEGDEECALPTVSEPEAYSKLGHLLKFHTWAPAYVDYDAISSMSFSSLYSAATLGATVFFQNELATATGSIGYSASRPEGKKWRHLLDLRFNYSGLYPVFETSLKLDNGGASYYQFTRVTGTDGKVSNAVTATDRPGLGISFSAKAYVPLNFSSGGWSRGLVPQLRYSVGNGVFDGSIWAGDRYGLFPEKDRSFVLTGVEPGRSVFQQNITASVRGYVVRPTAPSGVYPRWGIGAEAGLGFRPSLTHIYDPAVYGYLYGYVPGLVPEHGLKLTAIVQRQWAPERTYIAEQRVTTYPRGFAACSGALGRYLAQAYPTQAKLTFDYLMALLPVDWSGLGPVAYVKNFELGFHGDAGVYPATAARSAGAASDAGNNPAGERTRRSPGSLMSAGASLSVRLGNLLWIPFDTRIGLDWSYNFGPSYEAIRAAGVPLERHHFGFLFSIDY